MCLNPVNEEFDRAYANVGLLASDVWSYQNEEVDYKKANLNLWLRFNETEKRLIEDDSSDDIPNCTEANYTVQDVIPFSRLASYNNFEYNEEREKMYVDDEPLQYLQNSYNFGHEDLEVWMLPEVDREFKKYTMGSQSGWCMLSTRYPSGRDLVSVERVTNASPQEWLSETQWPNRLLSHYAERLYSLKLSSEPSLFRVDLEPPTYNPEEVEMKLMEYPCPRYLIETNIDHRLQEIINSPTIRNLWTNPSYPYGSYSQNFGLNVEVPEFLPDAFSSKLKEEREDFDHVNTTQFPKNVGQTFHEFTAYDSSFGSRQQHYISIFDNDYVREIFPYSGPFDKNTEEPETVPMELNEEVLSNSMVINPSRVYFNLELLKPNWKHEDGDNSLNLVTFPDGELNEIVEQQLEPWTHLSRKQAYNKSQNTEKMIEFLEKWVSKIYNPRSSDFDYMSSLSGRINQIFQNVQQGYCVVQGPTPVIQPPVNRPLYSDVLMSEVNPTPTNSESKFDELEQEALEQYSAGSDTTLTFSPPQNTTAPQNTQQVSEKLNSDENFNPRGHSDDVKPGKLSSFSGSAVAERRRDLRPGNLILRDVSQESFASGQSFVSGSKRENEAESNCEGCQSIKQAKWMKKKKKKTEKRKKNSKHNKKKQPIENLLNHNHNRKQVESEIILINHFLGLANIFKQTFFLGNWRVIEEGLTDQVKKAFETSLSMLEYCSELFMLLVTQRENSDDFTKLKKRIDLMRKTISLLENILRTFQQYIYLYSKIKMTIPCDHRLLLDPKTLIKQKPITPSQLNVAVVNNCFYKVGLLGTVPNGKYLLKLLNSVILEERLTLSFKHKWLLQQNLDVPVNNRRTYEIKINFKEWRIHLAESEMEKEEPNSNVSQKLVKIVEDHPTWYSWQWKFIDGWKLDMNDSSFSFHWCNRFSVRILEETATSARLFVMYNWLFDLIDAVVLNKHYPSCEVLWNRKVPNLVSSKMVFFRLLLQKERSWYFGDVRINQQACCPLYSGCENSCCVTWMLNYDSINTTGVTLTPKRRMPRVMERSTRTRCKKEKNKKNRSESKSKANNCPPENQLLFNNIKGVNNEINLPQEKSSCAIQ